MADTRGSLALVFQFVEKERLEKTLLHNSTVLLWKLRAKTFMADNGERKKVEL